MKLRTRISLLTSILLIMCCMILSILNAASTHTMMDNIRALEAGSQSFSSYTRLKAYNTHEERNDERLLIGFAAVILFGGACSYVTAYFALRPLRRMAGRMEEFSAEDLSMRIPIPRTGDESEHLVRAFNSMADRLEQSFLREKRISDSMAHEFRTPLAVLLAKYELFEMKGDRVGRDDMKALFSLSKQKVEYLSSITTKLLDLNRKLRSADFSEESMDGILEDVILLHEESAGKKGIRLAAVPSGAYLRCDRDLFLQMLSDVVDNARKYTPDHGRVSVETSSHDGRLIIRIRDTGIGIPDGSKSMVFEPFYRVDASRSRETGGSGLGLVFASDVVKLHEGTVEVGDNPGGGTVFSLSFPL